MTTLKDWAIKPPTTRAELGQYRNLKIQGYRAEVHGVRIATGKIWDLDHFIPHNYLMDGFIYIRSRCIVAEVNVDVYYAANVLLSLAEKPLAPAPLPDLDSDQALFTHFHQTGELVAIFCKRQYECIFARITGVDHKSCDVRPINDQVEESDETFRLEYNKVRMVLANTHQLKYYQMYQQRCRHGES
ncbi:hypothetical protein [Dawidia soli]|uniref:Uncharacterized protein n=1 Tax=Dawidia soli TaxID=2782352 RepID=A0AAP2GF84_9BACT|nr:hypothetical protein [Dawidia soli]MBT1689227.1 hypothetical protein [Dawidia soli]